MLTELMFIRSKTHNQKKSKQNVKTDAFWKYLI